MKDNYGSGGRTDVDAALALLEQIVGAAEELKFGLNLLPGKHVPRFLELSMDVLDVLARLGRGAPEVIACYVVLRRHAPKSGFDVDLVFSPREMLVRDLHLSCSRADQVLRVLKNEGLIERTTLQDDSRKVVGSCYRVFGALPEEGGRP